MSNSSADRNPVERLAEEFLERHRRGEHPPLTEYVERHPEWAEEIRDLFPALVMMERLKPATGDVTGTFVGGARSEPGRVPERLGDFRILRELGRGGMGIVYEAEQESLGRHVALKVLPSRALLDPRHLQRFLREARAAARLHHTNIVPVFGVGEEGGLHYYVMQFIAGSGLHEVVDELRRLKAADRPTAEADARPSSTGNLPEITRGLLTGQFAAATGDAPDGPPATDSPGPATSDVHARSAILSGSVRNLAREVARVGLQVAEALEYAHGQGVLHRDIKPSNLLLDVQGTVWVADFGLAKAMAGGDDLTHEGDVLGTLRYMAPERLRGEADARSDLYALGLTLYELLTLRPAFDQDDRDRLILQVTTEVPPRPRAINAEIPRDLETILLKAIEHDPSRRYQDAEDLADDLQRFLADRPIKARPVGALERAGKWARRKPAIAGLLAALALAVVSGFAGITWQWRQAVAARNTARRNEENAKRDLAQAVKTVDTFCTRVGEEHLLDEPGMQPLRRRLLGLALESYQNFQRQHGDDPSLMKELALTFLRSAIITNELGKTNEAHILLLRAQDILEELHRADPKDITPRVQLARCYNEIESLFGSNEYPMMGQGSSNPRFTKMPSMALMEPLVAADPGNLDYLRLLGRSYAMNGLRHFRMERFSASLDSLKKSIATLERVCRTAPEDVEAVRWLALASVDLGLVYQYTGHYAENERALQKAQAIFEGLERRAPRSRRYRLDRSECLVRLGLARLDLGRFQDAALCFRQADDRLGRLSREDPEAVDVRYWLAVAKRGLGEVALAQGRTTAGQFLHESIALHEPIPAKLLPARCATALAWAYLGLGRAELQAGHPEAVPPLQGRLVDLREALKQRFLTGSSGSGPGRDMAQIEELIEPSLATARAATAAERIAAQRREVRARESWAKKQPDNPARRFEIAWGVVQLAGLLEADGQMAEARSSLDRALPTLEEPTNADPEDLRWRQGLARACESLARVQARSGQAAEAHDSAGRAVAIAEDLARIDPAYTYDLACMLGLRGMTSSSGDDAGSAIAALRRAIEAGFDNDHLLRTDPRLAPLRSRPDFPAPVGVSR